MKKGDKPIEKKTVVRDERRTKKPKKHTPGGPAQGK